MRQKSKGSKEGAEATVRDIRRRARKQYSAEEKIRIVPAGSRNVDRSFRRSSDRRIRLTETGYPLYLEQINTRVR